MNFLIIHNRYSRTGGEESVVEAQAELLLRAGHSVELYQRSYDEIHEWRFGHLASLFSALYNRRAVAEVQAIVSRQVIDVAIIHNLYPVISPAILPVLHRAGIKVVMSVHNYRLICPTGLFYTHGHVCTRCGDGVLREWNCAIRKCESSILGSWAYALRGWWARIKGYYVHNVDTFMALSDFQRSILIKYGIPGEKIAVVPNFINPPIADIMPPDSTAPEYIAYVGRLSHEKGIDLLFQTARRLPSVQFKVAGAPAADIDLSSVPSNVELVGYLSGDALASFYVGARAVALTSRCWEGLPLTVIEAMHYGCVVVVPDWAALPEVVDAGRAGILYTAGSVEDLAAKIATLYNGAQRLESMKVSARERADGLYSTKQYYNALMSIVTKLSRDR